MIFILNLPNLNRMRKKNVMLIGSIEQENLYSKIFKAFSLNNRIKLEAHPLPPGTLGTPKFEHHCIVEDVEIVVFCGEPNPADIKDSFGKENATKSIMIFLPGEIEKMFQDSPSEFLHNIIAIHDKHVGKRTPQNNP